MRGICGSFIDLARTQQCPDDPTMQPLGRGGEDNLAICLFRSCSETHCCGAGLVCENIGMPEGACLPIDDPQNPNIECTIVRDAGTTTDAQPDAR